MSLPINDDENEQLLKNRPADDIYPAIKHHVEYVKELEAITKEKIIDLIREDMIQDFALSNALDDIGKVIEYLSQEKEIERPEFSGKALMRDFSRISKLKLSLDYAKALNVDSKTFEKVLDAEISRLWVSPFTSQPKKQITMDMNTQFPVDNGVSKKELNGKNE